MSEYDSKALASAREVMAIIKQEHIGGDAQLLAKIQLLFVDAMQYAAPQSKCTVTPVGWKLVPLIAFPSQWAAGQRAFDSAGMNKVDAVYKAMVAAAPQSFGNSEQLEPASQPCKLRDGLAAIRKLGPIDAEKIQVERDVLNEPTCWCLTCRPVTMTDMRFVVCPECGNKRCPKANDHRNPCSGSNEPGQDGSAYPAAPKQESE